VKTHAHIWIYIDQFFLILRNNSDKCRENQNTFYVQWFCFCRFEGNVERYSTARQATDGHTIRRVHIESWIYEATDMQPEYVIISQQKRLCERASMLRLYVHCLSRSVLRLPVVLRAVWTIHTGYVRRHIKPESSAFYASKQGQDNAMCPFCGCHALATYILVFG
jgi:hypothetical protein